MLGDWNLKRKKTKILDKGKRAARFQKKYNTKIDKDMHLPLKKSFCCLGMRP